MPPNRRLKSKMQLLLFILLLSSNLHAQQSKSFNYYDSITYNLFILNEWKELIANGNDALKHNFDYYYLEVRMGIAYYNLQNYRTSIAHFEKALSFNAGDPFTLSYLYYAYLGSGRANEAAKLASDHKSVIAAIPGSGKHFVQSFYTEGGLTSGVNGQQSAARLMGNSGIYGEEETYGMQTYTHAGIQAQLLPSLHLYASGTMIGIDKQKHFAFTSLSSESQVIVTDSLFPFHFVQKELFFSTSFLTGKGITISPAFHYIKGDNTIVNASSIDNAYVFGKVSNPYSNYVVSLSLTKEFGNFTLGLNGSYAKLTSSGKQQQMGASVTWYPKGNLNIYSTAAITGFRYGNDKRAITDFAAGGKIASRLWLEGTITIGNLSFYNEKNAFVVYNLPEKILFRGGINLICNLSQHIDLSLMYRYYLREYNYYNYGINLQTGESTLLTNNMKYNNQSFFGGLKWRF